MILELMSMTTYEDMRMHFQIYLIVAFPQRSRRRFLGIKRIGKEPKG